MHRIVIALALLFALGGGLPDAEARSAAPVRAFRRANPCPATGQVWGRCPGWQVDHVVPLCAGGPDTPVNMQWLRIETHKRKTKVDVRQCRIRQQKKGKK
jgi:hypothetical protein